MNIIPLLLLAATSRADTTSTPTRGIDNVKSTSQPSDAVGPIWYNRQPALTPDDRHQTSYLFCKMAHNGRDQWSETTEPDVNRLPVFGGVKSPQKVCSQCFCLPNTQRVGCVETDCDDTAEVSRKAMVPRLAKRLPPSVPELSIMRTRVPGFYVNYEACVRANHDRVFSRGCNRCVCRQDGVVLCTNKVCTRSLEAVNASGERHPAPVLTLVDQKLVDPALLEPNSEPNTPSIVGRFRTSNVRLSEPLRGKGIKDQPVAYESYEQCLDAHRGSRTFYVDCNLCICGYDGVVACTMKTCPPPLPPPRVSDSISMPTERPQPPTPTSPVSGQTSAGATVLPTFTRPLPAEIDPISTPAAPNSRDNNPYSRCVDANGGPDFRRWFRVCSCLADGKVSCRFVLFARLFPIPQPTVSTPSSD